MVTAFLFCAKFLIFIPFLFDIFRTFALTKAYMNL